MDDLDDIDNVSEEELEVVEPNVGEDVLDDDIDNDDDDDMENPLNMSSELDDTDDALDEEEE